MKIVFKTWYSIVYKVMRPISLKNNSKNNDFKRQLRNALFEGLQWQHCIRHIISFLKLLQITRQNFLEEEELKGLYHPWISTFIIEKINLIAIFKSFSLRSRRFFRWHIKLYHYGAQNAMVIIEVTPLFSSKYRLSLMFFHHVNIIPEGFCTIFVHCGLLAVKWRLYP